MDMIRVLAILATYNEERFIDACMTNLVRQGLDVYLIDNESTDRTLEIAERYRGRGLVGTETLPRGGLYRWEQILARKAEIAADCGYDWCLHVDADEIRLPPARFATLAEAVTNADARGYNAINFMEFAFVPTLEDPDHEHPDFQQTMRWYYPFLPTPQYRLTLWKRQPAPVDLLNEGGHQVLFPGLRALPESFPMRHYLFLSVEHAKEKWVERPYAPDELERGWHKMRAALRASDIRLHSRRTLRTYTTDAALDDTEPLTAHPLFAPARARLEGSG
ncbi:MAG: glycosyltransferase family 2 protein [Thiohalocapsa sp.]|nr:glycosyltransferase family 2 protein [Thiohalocapsa sp.]MCF7991342.1 glycosyltransferase family 2 protein [Thiohalocapsa sp.]